MPILDILSVRGAPTKETFRIRELVINETPDQINILEKSNEKSENESIPEICRLSWKNPPKLLLESQTYRYCFGRIIT